MGSTPFSRVMSYVSFSHLVGLILSSRLIIKSYSIAGPGEDDHDMIEVFVSLSNMKTSLGASLRWAKVIFVRVVPNESIRLAILPSLVKIFYSIYIDK